MSTAIAGARVLLPDGRLEPATVRLDGPIIAAVGAPAAAGEVIDAAGHLLLPGLVDIHGDAFERQLMPRPGVHFPPAVALVDTDQQLAANGITTAFHGVTCSWEPGLRSMAGMRALLAALDEVGPHLGVDTRVHLRWETHALDEVDELVTLIAEGRVHLLAFNDHVPDIARKVATPAGLATYAGRAGVAAEDFRTRLAAVAARGPDAPAAMRRMAAAASARGIAMLAHDERSEAERMRHRGLGAIISEFPLTRAAVLAASEAGEPVVMGAPNVVRGGSHGGNLVASDYVGEGHCSVLASDYHYPSLRLAPFRLAADGVSTLAEAWRLVSAAPAAAAGLDDRGCIAPGKRADLVLVDATDPRLPRVIATWVAGRQVHGGGFRGGAGRA